MESNFDIVKRVGFGITNSHHKPRCYQNLLNDRQANFTENLRLDTLPTAPETLPSQGPKLL